MVDSKHPPATIPNSEVVKIRSRYVDQEFEISISLPPSYSKTKNYPVLYLLDSNWFFTIVTGIVKHLNTFGFWDKIRLPDMIIVGIGYPAEGTDAITFRSRDYTPVEDNEFFQKMLVPGGADPNFRPNSGGAPEFLQFISEELMPYIESNYRVDLNDKTIAGHSYGGLFPSYVLFTKPDMFDRYVICSPSLWYKDGVVFDYEEEYSKKHDELPVRVFISAGINEKPPTTNISELVRRLVEVLNERNYDGLVMEDIIFDDESHMSVIPASFTRGIISVFKLNP